MPEASHPVVLLDIDGLKRDVLYNMLIDGKLPALERIFGEGAWVRNGVTVFPSETLPAQTSLFTGLNIRRHGIVGNGWLDRTGETAKLIDFSKADTAAMVFGYRLYGFPSLLLPVTDERGLVNRAMYPGARTLYHALSDAGRTSHVIYNHISGGATRWIRPTRGDMVYFALTQKARVDYARLDRRTFTTTERAVRKFGMPDLLTIYFCGLDTWGHHTTREGQDAYLAHTIEPIIFKLLDLLDELNVLDKTRFALCSDHGHSWLGDRHRLSHTALMDALAGGGFHPVAHSPLPPDADCYINVIGGCAQLHVRNRADNNWRTPPSVENDLIPVAKLLAGFEHDCENNGAPATGCLSLILVRPAPDADYHVFHDDALVPVEKFFWNKLNQYPHAFQNIYGLNCPRSGDIVIFTDFERGFYFSDETVPRSHGSLSPDDMSIPILFSGPGIRRRIIERAGIIDIAPTIARLLGADFSGMDGHPLNVLE